MEGVRVSSGRMRNRPEADLKQRKPEFAPQPDTWNEMPTWGGATRPLSPAIVGDAHLGAEKHLQPAE